MQIMSRKGAATSHVNKLLMLVLVVIAVAALAPTIFTYVKNITDDTNIPGWVSALVGLGAGFALVLIIFAVVGRSK